MLLAIRKIMRMARDWGGPFFLVKVDVTKAFDTTSQASMRLWVALLHAAELNIQIGDTGIIIAQSSGDRQGDQTVRSPSPHRWEGRWTKRPRR